MVQNKFDAEKAIEVLLYITERAPNMYNALKVLYFADKKHLEKYGRLICGDSYVAMSKGPVPSKTYDIVKYLRGDGDPWFNIPDSDAFSVEGNYINPHRSPNRDLLSESDIECLDEAIEEFGHMPFGELKEKSHTEDWKSADENDFIAIEEIIKTLPSSEELLEYIKG